MSFSLALIEKTERLLAKARAKKVHIRTAESCTGGLIGGLLTAIPGSSDVFDRGFITYSNDAKRELLGVPSLTLRQVGAVARETAAAMAEGAIRETRLPCLSISVTGIAGPDGGSADKPVGTVWFGVAGLGRPTSTMRFVFDGLDRDGVRLATVEKAIDLLSEALA